MLLRPQALQGLLVKLYIVAGLLDISMATVQQELLHSVRGAK